MKMPGGGPHGWKVAPGAVTDDSEMAMSMIWAILDSNTEITHGGPRNLDLDHLADYYGQWFRSEPSGTGRATRRVFEIYNDKNVEAKA